jgi:hypothetical protein
MRTGKPSHGRSANVLFYRLCTRLELVPHLGQTDDGREARSSIWIGPALGRRQINSTSGMLGINAPCFISKVYTCPTKTVQGYMRRRSRCNSQDAWP